MLPRHTRDHNQEFHQMIIDTRRTRALQDKDILITDRRVDLDRGLEREKLGDMARCELDTQSVHFSSLRNGVALSVVQEHLKQRTDR